MTLLIKNVKILGGNKDFGEHSDVFVVGDKISAIGNFPQKSADTVLDGQGSFLSPGFIDIGSTADHYLDILENPAQENLLSQGITTIVGGQCGFSLAPLLYGRLDMIRKWADINKVNVNWHTTKDFFYNLKKLKLGVNFATLTGHLTVRQEILGEASRDLAQNELSVLKKVIADSMNDGSAGISFGLEYSHGKNVALKELKGLAEIVAKQNGICAIHSRDRGMGVVAAFNEACSITRSTGVRTVISHFSPLKIAKDEYEKVLREIYELPPDFELYLSTRPFEENIMPIYIALPESAKKGGLDEMVSAIKDDWLFARIAKELPVFDPLKTRILRAIKNESLEGKNLAELMEIYALKTVPDVLRKVMLTTELRATLSVGELDSGLLVSAWKNHRSVIGTFSPNIKSREFTMMRFFDRVEKEELFPLEDAIWKITGFPAKILGLKGRGRVAEGNFADLTIFKNGEVKFTIVGGCLAYSADGAKTMAFGKPLIHTENGF